MIHGFDSYVGKSWCVMNHKSFGIREYKFKNTKCTRGFNMVQPIMPTSTDERKYFYYS